MHIHAAVVRVLAFNLSGAVSLDHQIQGVVVAVDPWLVTELQRVSLFHAQHLVVVRDELDDVRGRFASALVERPL
ncbi:hypothetical protein D3C86_2030620 [compost metagenome]